MRKVIGYFATLLKLLGIHLYTWTHGHIYYKVLGEVDAPALVLLHTPEIGGSSYEMRALVKKLSQHYRIYVLDLLGFGLSDRPKLEYTADLYVSLLQGFLSKIVTRSATLLASGLSCNYSVMVAALSPQLCESLIFLSPVSLFEYDKKRNLLSQIVQTPFIGFVLYALLTSRVILQHVVAWQKDVTSESIATNELDYYFAAVHQLGAHHAALAFLAGKLALDVSQQLETVQQPILIVWGAQTLNSAQSLASQHSVTPHTQVVLLQDAGIRVQEERPDKVIANILEWRVEEQHAPLSEVRVVPTIPRASANTEEQKALAVASMSVQPAVVENEAKEANTTAVENSTATVEAYCVKCRHKRMMQDPQEIVTKNGRRAMEGTCPVCGTRLFRFIAA